MKHLLLLSTLVAASSLAHGALFEFAATLDGPSESPANASPGTGSALFSYDSVAHTFEIDVTFSGLLGTTTAAHIHAPTLVPGVSTAGVATTTPNFSGFPLGVSSGFYNNTLDLTDASSYNPSYITANGGTPESAEVALINSINEGRAYLNIHSTSFGGGEIRGFLVAVPEVGETCVVSGALLCGFAVFRRFRMASA